MDDGNYITVPVQAFFNLRDADLLAPIALQYLPHSTYHHGRPIYGIAELTLPRTVRAIIKTPVERKE